jgi:hypothetical protein
MVKLFRLIWLVSHSIVLLFLHLIGLVSFAVAVAVGYFRLPSWLVPILAVAFGVITDQFVDMSDVTGVLEKADAANKRGGFLILSHFIITALGYVAGAYARHKFEKRGGEAATPAKK